jgi:hypothetical protein
MVWSKLGSETGSGSSVDITNLTAKKHNQIISHLLQNGDVDLRMRLGNGSFDTSSNYADRFNYNGDSTDYTYNTQDDWHIINTSATHDSLLLVMEIINIDTEIKLSIFHCVHNRATGAGSVPDRMEGVNKWVNTSDQFDYIQLKDLSGSEIGSDTNISVFGTD